MAHSSRQALVAKWRAWKREHPEYPLSPHAAGQWCKKVRGRLHYFGPLEQHELAVKLWLHQRDWLLAGEEPPGPDDGWTVGKLAAAWKADVEARRDAGEIVETHARDLLFAGRFIGEHLPRLRLVDKLTPTSFSSLREAVAATGRALRSQHNLISHIRAVFHWGAAMHHHQAVDFGPRFKPPGIDAIEREREARGTTRFIDRTTILAMLDQAKPAMKCMILLGINCGFYASDSIAIPFSRVHLDHRIPHHDFARVKNGRRRVGALWPETVEALRSYIAHHRGNNESDCIILNQYGRPYNENAVGRGIRTAWQNLAERAGVVMSPGTSIGSLRHTYGTVADLCPDSQAVDLSMGHAPKGIRKRIYVQLNLGELDRLKAAADVVRDWLYHGKIAGLPDTEVEDAQDDPVVLQLFGA